ncbi:MAG: ABATE domain-containing protein [Actinomycetes bacterium]
MACSYSASPPSSWAYSSSTGQGAEPDRERPPAVGVARGARGGGAGVWPSIWPTRSSSSATAPPPTCWTTRTAWPGGCAAPAARGGQRLRLQKLRGHVLALLAAAVRQRTLPPAAVAAVNRAGSAAPGVAQLEAGELVVRYNASPPDAFLADIATSAITLVGGPGRDRRRRRGAPGCGRWFVASRPRQRWCSPTCGDRARVARFQERRRARPGRTAHSAAAGPRMLP